MKAPNLTKLLLAAFTLSTAAAVGVTSAHAEANTSARVEYVMVHRNGTGYIQFDKNVSAGIKCDRSQDPDADWHPNRVSFVTNTQEGSAILSTALAAKLSGGTVWVGGSGTCDWEKEAEYLVWLTLM